MSSNETSPDSTSSSAQRDACQNCLLDGLAAIGINAQPGDTIDFGAIDSDDLCATMAHNIEACLYEKGWYVKPLTGSFQTLRAQGARLTVDSLTTSLVQLSWPVGGQQA